MELTQEEKEYIIKYEKNFHKLTQEEKEYIIKIFREENKKEALNFLGNF